MSDTTTNEPTNTIPYGYCHCGCGQFAPIAKRTRSDLGHTKGQPVRYIVGHSNVRSRKHVEKIALQPGTKAIPLTKGKFTIVDESDYEWLIQWRWQVASNRYTWYAIRKEYLPHGKPATIRMHRAILGAEPGINVDHINGDGLQNTRDNLRIATRSQNACNSRLRADNSSGFRGVFCQPCGRRWRARISVNGERIHLGLFDTPEEAARAYNEAAREMHGEFARLNDVPRPLA